ncbi:uncharacterized protein LOC111266867 isoform X2 [Varroa jacobsoni]|uniref:uncharacterized protein LOC111266867 isoform X2 n=1 Tax=Varroa jacobsoni TaxID=62625 RepID=UPI000BF8CC28|nr:uncharacterized protein LOC111266867 isoform X2 [Varroa jacobsoni]
MVMAIEDDGVAGIQLSEHIMTNNSSIRDTSMWLFLPRCYGVHVDGIDGLFPDKNKKCVYAKFRTCTVSCVQKFPSQAPCHYVIVVVPISKRGL